jgi:glycosyltransferase involved in cell wall biosynthesis
MSEKPPFVSICIPAYKRTDFLKRLLQSIVVQSFPDFEVIVTDDSPDESVMYLCEQYQYKFALRYFRNPQLLGTPENWNEAVRRANGVWIKLMHDDDWFTNEDSLRHFSDAVQSNPESFFFFSAYRNIHTDGSGPEKDILMNALQYKMLKENPAFLFSGNVIGPPSCVLYNRKTDIYFDNRLRWLVDIDFYIRYLLEARPFYIPKVLVHIGISEAQVTRDSFRINKVEIPEYFYLLDKMGTLMLDNIWAFDALWRLMRNLGIRNLEDIREAGYTDKIPKKIRAIVNWQKRIPPGLLKRGIISKIGMTCCFLLSKF